MSESTQEILAQIGHLSGTIETLAHEIDRLKDRLDVIDNVLHLHYQTIRRLLPDTYTDEP